MTEPTAIPHASMRTSPDPTRHSHAMKGRSIDLVSSRSLYAADGGLLAVVHSTQSNQDGELSPSDTGDFAHELALAWNARQANGAALDLIEALFAAFPALDPASAVYSEDADVSGADLVAFLAEGPGTPWIHSARNLLHLAGRGPSPAPGTEQIALPPDA